MTILRVAPLLACIALGCVDYSNTVFAQIPLPSPQIYNLSLEGKTYPVEYNIAHGNVTGIALNGSLGVMTVRVRNTSDGQFGITFPRELMTDMFRHGGGLDEVNYPSEVFLDSVPASAEIFANCESVHYVFPLTAGTSEIGFVREIGPEDLDAVPKQASPESYSFFFSSNYIPREYCTIGVTTDAENCGIYLIQREARLQLNLTSSSGSQTDLALVLPHDVLGGNFTVSLDGVPVTNYTTSFIPDGRYPPKSRVMRL